MRRAVTALLIASAGLGGCTSPEATRTRGGRGADVGNRPQIVEMHEGSQPFWETPERITTEHPSLTPAAQADQQSRQ
jgi:hypothetical protein